MVWKMNEPWTIIKIIQGSFYDCDAFSVRSLYTEGDIPSTFLNTRLK